MSISIIIPTYNEATQIADTIQSVQSHGDDRVDEIIVVDGQSSDNTVDVARSAGASVVVSPHKGRATQMNCGAGHARADVLYFLHADSTPPPHFAVKIIRAVQQGIPAGRLQLAFDDNHPLLRLATVPLRC
ncbi:MAG: glycosyltransferase [Fodinibius sp.]|nr:glycosyltransferase [Fodinibius sp.]